MRCFFIQQKGEIEKSKSSEHIVGSVGLDLQELSKHARVYELKSTPVPARGFPNVGAPALWLAKYLLEECRVCQSTICLSYV